jgi:hypothetical protein
LPLNWAGYAWVAGCLLGLRLSLALSIAASQWSHRQRSFIPCTQNSSSPVLHFAGDLHADLGCYAHSRSLSAASSTLRASLLARRRIHSDRLKPLASAATLQASHSASVQRIVRAGILPLRGLPRGRAALMNTVYTVLRKWQGLTSHLYKLVNLPFPQVSTWNFQDFSLCPAIIRLFVLHSADPHGKIRVAGTEPALARRVEREAKGD